MRIVTDRDIIDKPETLEELATAELTLLKARIQALLDNRRQEEEEVKQRQKQVQTDPKEQLFFSGQGGHYQWEYVSCGNKDRCKRCKAGKKHGPYLYRYFYIDGKQKSEYIKLSDVHKHPEAPARPV